MKPEQIHLHRIETTLQYQFPGIVIDEILNGIQIELSRGTKRIRSILNSEGELLFSLRPLDGFFIPTIIGAREMNASGYKSNIVVVNDDAAPFVAQGKTAFCKHIIYAHESIIPNTEVVVVDTKHNIIAIGTALHSASALLDLKSGPGIKIREGNQKITSNS